MSQNLNKVYCEAVLSRRVDTNTGRVLFFHFCLFILVFLVLYTPLVNAEIVLNKDAPGVGVVNPKEWMKDYIENQFKDAAFGAEVSEGFDQIFKKTYDTLLSQKDRYKGCNGAAIQQATSVGFELNNARVLRGAGEMFFGIEKKLIGLGGGSIADFLKSQAEDAIRNKISDAMKDEKTEVYQNSYSINKVGSGKCEQSVSAVWNKAGGTYTIFISGNCNCEKVPDGVLTGREVRLAEWTVVARGTVRAVPNRDKTGLMTIAGIPSISVSANCNCVLSDDGTWLPPPPPEEEEEEGKEKEEVEEAPIRVLPVGRMRTMSGVKCEACRPALDAVNQLVEKFNKIAGEMDDLAEKINAEPNKTAERDSNVSQWEKLKIQLDKTVQQHDTAFEAFVKCEEDECDLGTGSLVLDELSEISEQWTDCKECIELMNAVNAQIQDYNNKVKELNKLATDARRERHQLGTAEGNRVYREWRTGHAALNSLNADIQQKIAQLSACKSRYCSGTRWQSWVPTRPISGTCTPCISFQEKYNEAAKEYNVVIDKLNALQNKQREYIEQYGDSGAGQAGYERLLINEDLHGLLKAEREGRAKLDSIKNELDTCVEEKCKPVSTTADQIRIGQDVKPLESYCEGSACPDDISVLCSGYSCPDSFTLNCGNGTCPDTLLLDCTAASCPQNTAYDCGAGGCPALTNFICDDNDCSYVMPASDPFIGTDPQFDYSTINFDDLDSFSSGYSYSDGSFQVPFSGTALNTALGLEPDTTPAATLQQLQQAEQQAVQDAINANNYSNTVADAFQQAGSTSIQTASSLAAATEAAGVQEFLIDFGSALADLASVSDFFEGLAKGDMSDNSLLQNLDSIYEAAKDGESLANNIADQIQPIPDGSGISTSPINDAFGTMGVADDYWGTDGLTNINSLKSDFSDIANLIDDHRSGKPINPRTLGQLIFRIGKGFAENDLKERKQQIANLQQDLAAEQRTTSGLAGQLQTANEAKWNAIDELAKIRAAIAALLASNPESLSVTVSGDSPVIQTTAKCPECQSIADQINQALNAMYAARQQIAAIQTRQQALESKKAKLQQLQNQLESADQVLNAARAGLRSTDVPVLGPAQEIQNQINLLQMDRRQLVNEIGRLQREIEIEEGDPEAEIESLEKAISTLRDQLQDLRYNLSVCEEDKCKTDTALGRDLIQIFGPIFDVEIIDTKNISGNDPYNPRDPIAENNENIQQGVPTVQVINNIPIARLALAGPDSCPANHFHGAANNCNGVFTVDPNPPGCGHGTVAQVISIPVTLCPDL